MEKRGITNPSYLRPVPASAGQPSAGYPQSGPPQPGAPQHGKLQYSQPVGTNVIVVTQPVPAPTPFYDYRMPKGMAPGVILLIVGIINFIFFIAVAVMRGNPHAYWITSVWYIITAILAIVAAAKQPQHSPGIVIGCMVMAILSLIPSVVELITAGLAVGLLGAVTHYNGDLTTPLLVVCILVLLLALLAVCTTIALIVVTSQKVCDCCRPLHERQPGNAYIQHTAGHP